MQKYLPDAFLFAIILTFIVFLGAVFVTPKGPIEVIDIWGSGVWNLTKFAMEMVLILVSGFTLAKTPFVTMLLDKVAKLADSQTKAILLACAVSSVACLLNWGLGLIVAALISVEIAKRVPRINFGLLIAASYSGFILWHGGLSGSIPLKLTNPSEAFQDLLGSSSIFLEQSLLNSLNLGMLVLNFSVILLVNYFLSKQDSESTVNIDQLQTSRYTEESENNFAAKLENSRFISNALSALALIYIGHYLWIGKGINLGFISFIFFFLAFILHRTPKQFLFYFSDSVGKSSGIILQFPLYAGIMAIMKGTGLADQLSQVFLSISSEQTFLVFTYWSAGLVNFFVPSGGGQWALQAPFILPAANELGIDTIKAAMAIAWGDAWSNMVQPFWALPLLSVARVKLKEMMGYSVIIFIFTGLASSLFLVMI